jgi:hypothetical protein
MTLSVNVLPGSVLLNKLRQKLGLLPQPILR